MELRYWLTLQRVVVLIFRYRQRVNIGNINSVVDNDSFEELNEGQLEKELSFV